MWVFCCGMRRSGSTLQYQIVTDLVTRKELGSGLGYCLPNRFNEMAEIHKNDRSFKVVKTHVFIPEAEQLLRSGTAKALYSYRDIRDVIASLMNMQNIGFSKLCDKAMIYLLLKEFDDWTRAGDVYVSRYEEMISDLPQEVSRIAAYLGWHLQEGEALTIAEKYSLERQKERISQFKLDQMRETPVGTMIDPATLLHTTHIKSGGEGRWSDTLSNNEVAVVEHIARDWMREHGYSFSQNWLTRKVNGMCFQLEGKIKELFGRRNSA